MNKLVECVPNISEGRNRQVIDAIVSAARVDGVEVLDVDPGKATNRTVITLVGAPENILEAAFRLIQKSCELIDMSKHKGEHPRFGATDVCPFVPVQGVSMQECVELARKLGERVGSELELPVYLYEHAATSEERKSLAYVRKGEYEGLPDKLGDPQMQPDFGPAQFNPRFGAIAIGARPFLIAYNINLNTKNKKHASWIAVRLRESGYRKRDQNGKFVYDQDGNPVMEPGKFKCCRAVGWYIDEFGIAQVSINLTNYEVTNMYHVFDEAREIARTRGVRVTGSEIVGLVPKNALLECGRHYLKEQGATTGVSDREIMQTAVKSLGLSDLYPFKIEEKVIEERVKERRPLIELPVFEFQELLASDAPAPGGGSVSALAGALSASLTAMVSALTHAKAKKREQEKKDLLEKLGIQAQQLAKTLTMAIDDDTAAFNRVMSAFRIKAATEEEEKHKEASIIAAYREATSVPLKVAEACHQALKLSLEALKHGMQSAFSDAAVASQMAFAGFLGAGYNVRINLNELRSFKGDQSLQEYVNQTETALKKMNTDAIALIEEANKIVHQHFNP